MSRSTGVLQTNFASSLLPIHYSLLLPPYCIYNLLYILLALKQIQLTLCKNYFLASSSLAL